MLPEELEGNGVGPAEFFFGFREFLISSYPGLDLFALPDGAHCSLATGMGKGGRRTGTWGSKVREMRLADLA